MANDKYIKTKCLSSDLRPTLKKKSSKPAIFPAMGQGLENKRLVYPLSRLKASSIRGLEVV
jgi:hypothetical protein